MKQELKKRDCDIKIKLTPSGTQYLHFEMDIQGDHLEFLPASTVGEQFGAIINALYSLFPEKYDMHDERHCSTFLTDENHVAQEIMASVSWDNEGDEIVIYLFRKPVIDIDYENDTIEIEINRYDEVIKKYIVKSKDLCYAVAKACTEVLKAYGFYGYRYSTEHDYFDLHQLLYIKAFALLNFEARELASVRQNEWAKKTTFEKEMELLLFDM